MIVCKSKRAESPLFWKVPSWSFFWKVCEVASQGRPVTQAGWVLVSRSLYGYRGLGSGVSPGRGNRLEAWTAGLRAGPEAVKVERAERHHADEILRIHFSNFCEKSAPQG
jgi:hypothetical protein